MEQDNNEDFRGFNLNVNHNANDSTPLVTVKFDAPVLDYVSDDDHLPVELVMDEGPRHRGRPRKCPNPQKLVSGGVGRLKKASDWGLERFICVLCQKPYKTISNLQKHMAGKHRVCQPVVQVKCEFCGNVFADQLQFESHAEGASRELSLNTGVVAQLRRDQLDYSQTLTTLARELVRDDGRKNQEVLEQNFNYPPARDLAQPMILSTQANF